MEQTQYDVFISYSRKDIEIADRICQALRNHGITFFIDRQGIGGGMEFPLVLAQAIRNSKLFSTSPLASLYRSLRLLLRPL